MPLSEPIIDGVRESTVLDPCTDEVSLRLRQHPMETSGTAVRVAMYEKDSDFVGTLIVRLFVSVTVLNTEWDTLSNALRD